MHRRRYQSRGHGRAADAISSGSPRAARLPMQPTLLIAMHMAVASGGTVLPTLAEYTRFHGMHIGPAAARRCVASFSNGAIIFAPSTYDAAKDFSAEDDVRSPYEVPLLTLGKYYALVLATLTGLSTMLGLTEILDAREDLDGVPLAPHPLYPGPAILAYVARRVGAPLVAVRRFEYRFRLVGLRVVMLHYRTAKDERLHLIEVYESRLPLALAPKAAATAVLAVLLAFFARRLVGL